MIPYGRQSIQQQDIDAVVDVLNSDFLTQGPKVPEFEHNIAELVQVKHACAVNSATSALHIACLALGVGSGDLVWTSPISFVASANCALYCGADVDFVDIDLDTGNMSIAALEKKLINAERNGRLPKVVIPVHFSGQSCDMAAIHQLAQTYGFKIIEDASHGIGGQYLGKPIGCGQYSDLCVFSFHPVKIITTAEGGMVTTNDDKLAKQLTLYRSHGVTRDPALLTKASEGPWYYQQLALGYNYRMTELQAALGCSQLRQLKDLVAKRQQLTKSYDLAFADMPEVKTLTVNAHCQSACHLYVIQVAADKRLALFEHLRNCGIGVNLHYIPIYQQPYYQRLAYEFEACMNAEAYYQSAISIPLFAQLTAQEQQFIISSIREFLCN